MSQYLPREPAFAAKFARAMVFGQVAAKYGQSAFVLLATLAGYEDWISPQDGILSLANETLYPLCGFQSKQTLVTAREKLSESGWLEYVPGVRNRAATYRIEIPDDV